jgi:hypothetical protein
MQSSKRNKWISSVLGLLLSGCATPSYHVLFQDDRVAELNVSPDRVLLQCEDLYDADIKGMYGFMIHVLDSTNTVTTVVQTNTLDKDSCDGRLKKIGKILREGHRIYIAGRGDLNDIGSKDYESFVFPQKGSFPSNGRSLQFVAIANEYGLCYDAYSGFEEKPCPPEPFPFWNARR